MREFYVYVSFTIGYTERLQLADSAETACQLVLVSLMAEGHERPIDRLIPIEL